MGVICGQQTGTCGAYGKAHWTSKYVTSVHVVTNLFLYRFLEVSGVPRAGSFYACRRRLRVLGEHNLSVTSSALTLR